MEGQLMAPPPAAGPPGPPADEKSSAEGNLNRAKKLIHDLEKKGLDLSEAKGWFDQADEMFRGGLYRTSLIYSGYALDVATEMFERIKSMLVRISKVKSRANDMLGEDHGDMKAIEELVEQMKEAINEGRLDDCQEMINTADDVMRGSSSPYMATKTIAVTSAPSRGFSSCPSCGNIVESTWIECRYCDTNLQEEGEEKASGPAWSETTTGPLRVSGEGFMDNGASTEDELSEDVKELEKVTEEVEAVERDLESSVPKCPGCGEEVEPDFVKCPICKTQLK